MFPSPIAAGQTLHTVFAYLIYHPEVQKKIQKEIDEVVGRARLPNLDDRQKYRIFHFVLIFLPRFDL